MAKYRKAYKDTKHRHAPKHAFWYIVDGKKVPKRAVTRNGKKSFTIRLTENHVEAGMRAQAEGDGRRCPGNICFAEFAPSIGIKYAGASDWLSNRLYVSTKMDKYNMPTNCEAYAHNAPEVAELFDAKKGKQLIALIRKNGGGIDIDIKPVPPSRRSPGRNSGAKNATGIKRFRGHKLREHRYFTATAGTTAGITA